MRFSLHVAPLCPAGHLPLKGGDQPSPLLSPISSVAGRAEPAKPPISPLEGEMSGRTEGGAEGCNASADDRPYTRGHEIGRKSSNLRPVSKPPLQLPFAVEHKHLQF